MLETGNISEQVSVWECGVIQSLSELRAELQDEQGGSIYVVGTPNSSGYDHPE